MPETRSEDEETEYEEVAFEIVDEAISKAVEQITSEVKQNLKDISFEFEDRDDYGVENIEWSTCENFTTSNGITQIEKFVETWKRDNAWLYCIDYLGEEEYDYDVRYRYQVRWSIPTRRKPIPRATACTYFTISLSKIKPKTWEVTISGNLVEKHNREQNPDDGNCDLLDSQQSVFCEYFLSEFFSISITMTFWL